MMRYFGNLGGNQSVMREIPDFAGDLEPYAFVDYLIKCDKIFACKKAWIQTK